MIPLLKNKATTESIFGTITLAVTNAIGHIHMVVLPFWVGSLIASMKLDPREAGLMATLYIAGMLLSSALTGPRFTAIKPPLWAVGGLFFACLMFLLCMLGSSTQMLNILHFAAGIGVGISMSCTLGTLGRSANPHASFAKAKVGFGIAAFASLAIVPVIVEANGAMGMFAVMATITLTGVIASIVAFPSQPPLPAARPDDAQQPAAAIFSDKKNVVLAFAGIGLIITSHTLSWSFAQSLAALRKFSPEEVKLAFAASGLLSIAVPILAGALQKKWPAVWVCAVSGIVYGFSALWLSNSPLFAFYALSLLGLTFGILFAQIFAFGLIARLDPSGKASATLPAILTGGAAAGPFLGGLVVHQFGHPALGVASLLLACIGTAAFVTLARRMTRTKAAGTPAVASAGLMTATGPAAAPGVAAETLRTEWQG